MLLKIGDMSTLRIENENWIKKGFKFEVVLFKKNMLSLYVNFPLDSAEWLAQNLLCKCLLVNAQINIQMSCQ